MTVFSACSLSRAMQMVNCDYSFHGITGLSWAGINFGTTSTDQSKLGAGTLAKCAKAIANKDFTTTIGITLEAKNPDRRVASIAGFDYVVLYQNKEIASGVSINKEDIVVPAHGSTIIPMNFSIDITDVINFKSLKAIENTLHFLGEVKKLGDNDTDFAIKIRPHIRVGKTVTKGAYIPIKSI
ncbi:MAG: LEA type 2 family protein [Bacteroidales bacterium]|nr:LEA type 2 family protein [Bacteroidales bacterium]